MRDVVGGVVLKMCRGALTGSPSCMRVSEGAVGGVRTCDGVRVRLSGGRLTVRGGVVARGQGSHALAIMVASPGWRAVQIAATPPGGIMMGACAFVQLESEHVPRMW
jgi:hypothetical protein